MLSKKQDLLAQNKKYGKQKYTTNAAKIIDFIKYHNAFTIGLILVLFGAGAIFAASPEARDAVIGKEITQTEGVDNAALLAVDLNNFDLAVKIDNVTEDSKNYYVDYSFNTYGIIDNVWQKIARKVSMTVDKASLNGGDLGLYVQSQLANVAQNEIAYLKQVQTAEKEKGLTRVVVSREYTGLVGLVLDVKNAVLPDYEPVIEPQSIELAQVTPSVPAPESDEETKVKAELEKPTQTPPTGQDGTANTTSATAAVSGGNPPTSDNQSSAVSDHLANEGRRGIADSYQPGMPQAQQKLQAPQHQGQRRNQVWRMKRHRKHQEHQENRAMKPGPKQKLIAVE